VQKSYSGASSLLGHLTSRLHTKNSSHVQMQGENISSFVICLQEPPTKNGKVSGFGLQHPVYYDVKCNKPRAAIFASNDLNLWLLPEYTEGDMVSCVWRNGEVDVVVVSVYMDITKDCVVPPKLDRLVRTYQRKGVELLICADTNAHSPLWGSRDANRRGEIVEEFVSRHGLNIANKGSHFTFFNRRSATIINVTMCTSNLADRVEDWMVSSGVIGSDHLMCQFLITISIKDRIKVRNIRLGDWNLFQRTVADWVPPFPREWTTKHLKLMSKDLNGAIQKGLDVSHPKKKVSTSLRLFHWFTKELQELKRCVKLALSLYRKDRSEENFELLKTLRADYSRTLRREKRKAWQRFCGETKNLKEVATINKLVKRKERHVLGLIRKREGDEALSPEDSVNHLLQTHFPGCDEGEIPSSDDEQRRCDLEDPAAAFITNEKVKYAIESFGEFKAPGVDGIQPTVLRKLKGESLTWLTNIYRASYLLGYVPSQWRKARVIFIPKEGKPDYSQARAFRPITLSTIMVKVLERLILWEINETTLQENPLSCNQHAFRKGYSTESALSNAVEQIEAGTLSQQFTLGVFLDIQGAFDNVKPESILKGMEKKGIEPKIIQWYGHYLRNRGIVFEHRGVKANKRLHLGTPQGGVLSPLMWNLTFESLLEKFQRGSVKVNGFADDAALLVTGPYPNVLRHVMQDAVTKALDWGDQNGLTFSAAKTVAVLFTRKLKYKNPPNIHIRGQNIPYSPTVKYLGVTLDTKLSWTQHITQKVNAAKGHLIKVRGAMGKLWGLPPNLHRWLYTGIVRPSFCYGSLIWSKALDIPRNRDKCTKLNRLALLPLGHFRRSTPTAGLETIVNVMPLDLFTKREALLAWARTERHTKLRIREGHRSHYRKLLEELTPHFLTRIPLTPLWNGLDPTGWTRNPTMRASQVAILILTSILIAPG